MRPVEAKGPTSTVQVSLSNHRKPFDKLRANVSLFHITTTMRQCVPSANSSQSSFARIYKKTHPNGGTGQNPWCHPASSSGHQPEDLMSGTRAQVRAVMPRALITVALSVHAYALYLKGFGWRLPGPFGLCVHTGSHLTRLSERRRRPTTPVLSQFRIRLIAVYRRSAARVKVSCVPEPVSVWSVGQLLRMVLHSTRHSREGGSP